MEDGLGGQTIMNNGLSFIAVLILVLVEDGLGAMKMVNLRKRERSLNPCFSGGWSRSRWGYYDTIVYKGVLILVLVEDGLGERPRTALELDRIVLILVLVEDGLGVLEASANEIVLNES